MGATFSYNMEYFGPHTRLVFTPLTERAFLTLTIALKSFSCGALIGPSGTGKSDTIKDLAKVIIHVQFCPVLLFVHLIKSMHLLLISPFIVWVGYKNYFLNIVYCY